MFKSIGLSLLLHFSLAASVFAAVCSHDNCYRGLAGQSASASAFCSTYTTTINTATTGLPTYATLCSSSASRISSACSCLVTATTTTTSTTTSTTSTTLACTPSTIINETFRDGGFNQPPVPAGGAIPVHTPWFIGPFEYNGTVDFENVGSGTGHSGGVAVFTLVPQSYGTGNMPSGGSFVDLDNSITWCPESHYTISFAARQTPGPASQHCGIEIGWNASNYASLQGTQLSDTWMQYGPIAFESVGTFSPPDNPDGTYNGILNIGVSCYGVKGVAPPAKQLFELDSIIINAA